MKIRRIGYSTVNSDHPNQTGNISGQTGLVCAAVTVTVAMAAASLSLLVRSEFTLSCLPRASCLGVLTYLPTYLHMYLLTLHLNRNKCDEMSLTAAY